MSWVRGGYCCRCGDCCVGSPPDFPPPIDGMCPMLRPQPDGTRVCGVHDTDNAYWNAACKIWPTHPSNIANYPRCTFTFTWQDD